jgi:hypothetical protein
VSGGRITGTVAVVNGSFGRGGVVVAGVQLNANRVAGAFLDDAGPYTLWGLASGQWLVMAIYIPKSHTLDWTSYVISAFPVDRTATPVTVASGGTVANTDITLDLGAGLPDAMVAYRNIVSQALQMLARR